MRFIKLLFPLLLAASVFMTGCNKEEEQASIKLSADEITVLGNGGEASVTYTIGNLTDAIVSAVPEMEWVTDVNVETAGTIRFVVQANMTDKARVSAMTVSYPNLPDATLMIKQAAASKEAIAINVKEIQEQQVIVDLVPEDKNMEYIVMFADQAYFDMVGIVSDKDIFQDDMAYFEQVSLEYGMTIEEAIREYFLRQGDVAGLKVEGLMPNTNYVVYGYGINMETLERTTHITRKEVMTKTYEQLDVEFEINHEVNGQSGRFHVIPSNGYDGWWYFDVPIVPRNGETGEWSDMEGYDWEAEIERFIIQFVGQFVNAGWTVEEVYNSFFRQGDQKLAAQLPTKTVFYAIVVGANDAGFKCTPVSKVRFNSGNEVIPSENKITVEISDVQTNSARLITTTTVGCDSYVFRAVRKRDVEGKTPEEIADYIEYNYTLDLYQGPQDLTLEKLHSNTEYLGVTFGWWEDVRTTEVQINEFKTKSTAKSEVELTVEYNDYYDAAEVAALDSRYSQDMQAILPVRITSDTKGVKIYMAIYTAASADSFSDDELCGYIKDFGERDEYSMMAVNYDTEYRVYAFAEDGNQEYSPLIRTEKFTLTKDGASDAQEFIDLVNSLKLPARISPFGMLKDFSDEHVVIVNNSVKAEGFDLTRKYEAPKAAEHEITNVRIAAK